MLGHMEPRLYVTKFTKRRCVTYGAKDNLSPSFNKTKAIRAKLQNFTATSKNHMSQISKSVVDKTSDLCLRCGGIGHWAKDCSEPPQPQWLAKQHCHKCGLQGHLVKDCQQPKHDKGNNANKHNSTSSEFKRPNLSSLDFLPQIELRKHPNYHFLPTIIPQNADRRNYLKQRSPEWFAARKNKINASRASTALGVYGLLNARQYWNEVKGGQDSKIIEIRELRTLAMKWGTVCEDSARVTYLNYLNSTAPEALLSETGTWLINKKEIEFIAASPDDIIDMNDSGSKHLTGKGLVEYKCPFMGGFPKPYNTIPVSHFIQILINMKAINVQWCHYIVWTPKITHIYLIKQDNNLISDIINIFWEHFWNVEGSMDFLHPSMSDIIKRCEITASSYQPLTEIKSAVAMSSLSELSDFTPENIQKASDLEKAGETSKERKTKGKTISKCTNDNRKGITNKSMKKALLARIESTKRNEHCQVNLPLSYQSYVNGSEGISNSFHQDAFLEVFFKIAQRNSEWFNNMSLLPETSDCMKMIISSFKLYGEKKFHASKMLMWKFLCHKTIGGVRDYTIGNPCSLEAIIHRLPDYLTASECSFFKFDTSLRKECLQFSKHEKVRRKITRNTWIFKDDMTGIKSKSKVDIIDTFLKHTSAQGFKVRTVTCAFQKQMNENCQCPSFLFSRIESLPPLLIIEFQKKVGEDGSLKYKPYFKESFVVKSFEYRLVGLIYYSKAKYHYWAEVFVDCLQMNCKKGWYAHDGLRNNGVAYFVGEHPQLQSDGRHVTLAFYEQHKGIESTKEGAGKKRKLQPDNHFPQSEETSSSFSKKSNLI